MIKENLKNKDIQSRNLMIINDKHESSLIFIEKEVKNQGL